MLFDVISSIRLPPWCNCLSTVLFKVIYAIFEHYIMVNWVADESGVSEREQNSPNFQIEL